MQAIMSLQARHDERVYQSNLGKQDSTANPENQLAACLKTEFKQS